MPESLLCKLRLEYPKTLPITVITQCLVHLNHKQHSQIYCPTPMAVHSICSITPSISIRISDSNVTSAVMEKSSLTPASDSWLSAVLYLVILRGSHGRSLGIFILPECKCPAFAWQLLRSGRVSRVHEPLIRTFFSIRRCCRVEFQLQSHNWKMYCFLYWPFLH